jgi:hypothetical protein
MQSNLVSRPDESAGFGTFCGRFCLGWGIFSTLLQWAIRLAFGVAANEEALHFGWACAGFLWLEMGWIGGFGDICSFKVIPLLCN